MENEQRARTRDLTVRCEKCHRSRDLTSSLGVLPKECEGNRPWLDDQEPCEEDLHGLMRGASNVYFPMRDSSLSIPPFSGRIHRIITNHLAVARRNWERGKLEAYVDGNEELLTYVAAGTFTKDEIIHALSDRFSGVSTRGSSRTSGPLSLAVTLLRQATNSKPEGCRWVPAPSCRGGSPASSGSYDCARYSVFEDSLGFPRSVGRPRSHLSRSVRASNMQQVTEGPRLLRPPPLPTGAPRAAGSPAWSSLARGCSFRFNPTLMAQSLERAGARERIAVIRSSTRAPPAQDGVNLNDERLTFVHTLAHLLIRVVSLYCGYSMASLRERLYVGESDGQDTCGVLIYTASTDSEGTLGGLVAQAKDASTLTEHLAIAIQSAQNCSQDPLCAGHDPRQTGNPWGASCHACTQLPETSCEGLQNKILDRQALWL